MLADLHTHSTASDGQYRPAELIKLAKARGIRLLALTDHDTVEGLSEATQAEETLGLRVLNGVELGVAEYSHLHMLDMTVGALSVLVFEKEEKSEWGKYQRTMPVGVGEVMAGKYAAVLLTVLVSVVGAVVSNLAAFAFYWTFWPEVLVLSVLMAVAIPLTWTALSLPIYYWFGNQTAQYTSMPLAFLLFFAIKNFEDGGWTMSDLWSGNLSPILLAGLLVLAGMFLLSLALSAAGYCRRT